MAVEYTLFIFVLITSLFCDDDTHISKGPAINNGRGGAVGEKRGWLQLFLPELGAASN